MSHEVETMAYAHSAGANEEAYQVPWHGLGVPVSNDLTPTQMLKKAGLDWQVTRYPQFIEIDGERVKTGSEALVRSSDNRILTEVSDSWEPVQNQDAFDFFNEFVHSGQMEMNTAGSLKNGEMVWALAKVNESFDVGSNDDRVDSYLLFSNPHQYGRCIDIRFTAVRVVCNNTLTLALSKRGKGDLVVRLNHRKKFDPEMVKQTLGVAHKNMESYKEMATFLASKEYSVDSLVEYYNTVFPTLSKKDDRDPEKLSRPGKAAFEALESQPGAELGRGTWWQVYNSATFAVDHLIGRSADTRLQSAWYGQGRQKKIAALKTAVKMAEAA